MSKPNNSPVSDHLVAHGPEIDWTWRQELAQDLGGRGPHHRTPYVLEVRCWKRDKPPSSVVVQGPRGSSHRLRKGARAEPNHISRRALSLNLAGPYLHTHWSARLHIFETRSALLVSSNTRPAAFFLRPAPPTSSSALRVARRVEIIMTKRRFLLLNAVGQSCPKSRLWRLRIGDTLKRSLWMHRRSTGFFILT